MTAPAAERGRDRALDADGGEMKSPLGRASARLVVTLTLLLVAASLLLFLADFLEDSGVSSALAVSDLYRAVLSIPEWSVSVTSAYGGLALLLLMTMESSSLPIPSEVILPFAGYMVHTGHLSFADAFVATTVGSMAGSYVDYYIGRYLGSSAWLAGKPLFGNGVARAERWFERYGGVAVFGSRFLVGARTLVSFPAGASKMPLRKFSLLTLAGCSLYNAGLIYAGYLLSERWSQVASLMRHLYIPLAVGVLAVGGYLVLRYLRQERGGA